MLLWKGAFLKLFGAVRNGRRGATITSPRITDAPDAASGSGGDDEFLAGPRR